MNAPDLHELPPAPPGRRGFPWTEASPITRIESPARISLVTPSFNQAPFLEETIRSVLLQGYPHLEYFVIDGGSTDGSLEIIRKYAPWLAGWVSEPDRGQAHAINKGLNQATGSVMGWLNSDDCLLPGALANANAFLLANAAAEVMCAFSRYVVGQRTDPTRGRVHLRPDRFSLSRLCYVAQETTLWRRSVWERVGGPDEAFQFALDYELWQRMLACGYDFHLMPRFTARFRVHAHSKGSRMSERRAQELQRIYKRYLQSDKTEEELVLEISRVWRLRMRLLYVIGRTGLLNAPTLAEKIVAALSLPTSRIPAKV